MSFPTSAVVDANKHLLALCNNGNMIWSATNKTAHNKIASNGEQLTTATIFSPRQSGSHRSDANHTGTRHHRFSILKQPPENHPLT